MQVEPWGSASTVGPVAPPSGPTPPLPVRTDESHGSSSWVTPHLPFPCRSTEDPRPQRRVKPNHQEFAEPGLVGPVMIQNPINKSCFSFWLTPTDDLGVNMLCKIRKHRLSKLTFVTVSSTRGEFPQSYSDHLQLSCSNRTSRIGEVCRAPCGFSSPPPWRRASSSGACSGSAGRPRPSPDRKSTFPAGQTLRRWNNDSCLLQYLGCDVKTNKVQQV